MHKYLITYAIISESTPNSANFYNIVVECPSNDTVAVCLKHKESVEYTYKSQTLYNLKVRVVIMNVIKS